MCVCVHVHTCVCVICLYVMLCPQHAPIALSLDCGMMLRQNVWRECTIQIGAIEWFISWRMWVWFLNDIDMLTHWEPTTMIYSMLGCKAWAAPQIASLFPTMALVKSGGLEGCHLGHSLGAGSRYWGETRLKQKCFHIGLLWSHSNLSADLPFSASCYGFDLEISAVIFSRINKPRKSLQ